MDCKIYESCPYARNCSIIKEAEFCGYHHQHATKFQLDFIPVEEAPVLYNHDDTVQKEFDKIVLRANLRSSKRRPHEEHC
jgi:hypothetical protein